VGQNIIIHIFVQVESHKININIKVLYNIL